MGARLRAWARGTASVLLFGVFGLGALAISPFMLVLRRPERCHSIVRTAWRLILSVFVGLRLIRVECGNLASVSGAVVVANHPSLIDVVVLVSLIPRTLYVAKHGLKTNPFLAAIVRATALPDDATLPERAADYLARGWNVLVFPEGTRSPVAGGLQPLRRGAAQLALRTGAPVACVRLDVSRRILGKGQPPWDIGERPVVYALRMRELPGRTAHGAVRRSEAIRLTERMCEWLAGHDMV